MRAGSFQSEETASGERDPFRDPRVLDELRRHTFESIGVQYGLGILYGIGVTRGLVDGMLMNRLLHSGVRTSPQLPGSLICMVFSVRRGDLDGHFSGTLEGSCEAQLHGRTYGASNDPICFVTTGYAAGWYSAVLGKTIFVRETDCTACGSSTCRFEARPLEDWIEEADPWVEGLMPYLDFDRLRARAQEEIGTLEDELEESNMMGSFDSMSPAIHVWGPVMVLPYSGFQDSDAALGAVQADLGRRQIRVVVIDATGAAIDALEASGLVQLVNQLEAQWIETILVGLSSTARHLIPAGASPGTPLQTRDISQGIALAFQVCGAALSTNCELN